MGKPPKSSILIGFSIINHPFWGTPIFGNTHIYIYIHLSQLQVGPSRLFFRPLLSPQNGFQSVVLDDLVSWDGHKWTYFKTISGNGARALGTSIPAEIGNVLSPI